MRGPVLRSALQQARQELAERAQERRQETLVQQAQDTRDAAMVGLEEVPRLYFSPEARAEAVAAALDETSARDPPDVVEEQLVQLMSRLDSFRATVDQYLAREITAQTDEFLQGMRHVRETEVDLAWASRFCAEAREQMEYIHRTVVARGLGIVQDKQRSLRLEQIHGACQCIVRIRLRAARLQHALEEQNFEDAVRIISEDETVSDTEQLEGVTSIASTVALLKTGKLQLFHGMIEAIARLCEQQKDDHIQLRQETFDTIKLRGILRGYALLDEHRHEADFQVDLEYRHVFLAMLNRVSQGLFGDEEAQTDDLDGVDRFRELCSAMDAVMYITYFRRLLECYGHVLFCYHCICMTMREEKHVLAATAWSNRHLIWDHMQLLMQTLLESHQLTFAGTDDVLLLLTLGDRLMMVGDRFVNENVQGSGTQEVNSRKGSLGGEFLSTPSSRQRLKIPLLNKCMEHYECFYHRVFDQLLTTMSLHNWNALPLPPHYSITAIKELRAIERLPTPQVDYLSEIEPSLMNPGTDYAGDPAVVYDLFCRGISIFRGLTAESSEGHASSRQPTSPTSPGGSPTEPKVVITQSALSIVQFAARFAQNIRSLPPIKDQSFEALLELHDFYTYAVFTGLGLYIHSFFDSKAVGVARKYPSLHKTVNSIRDKVKSGQFAAGILQGTDANRPSPPPLVPLDSYVLDHLTDHNFLYGVAERAAAVESMRFLNQVYSWIFKRVSAFLEDGILVRFERFNRMSELTVEEFSTYMYRNLATKMIPLSQFTDILIPSRKWNIAELGAVQSPYVDTFIDLHYDFDRRLKELLLPSGLPRSVFLHVWQETITYSFEVLVDGFAKAKKCSTEGRAQMALDLSVIVSRLEEFAPFHALPGVSYADAYIKAYYLPEEELLSFAEKHPEYKKDHLLWLAHHGVVGASLKRKERDSLVHRIESIFEMNQLKKAGRKSYVDKAFL